MKIVGVIVRTIVVLVFVAGGGYLLYQQATPLFVKPCTTPLLYDVVGYDTRFGISEEEFSRALSEARALWNRELGTELITTGTPGIGVYMQYGEVQQTSELGEYIGSQQEAYDAKRVQVESLKLEFTSAKRKYEQMNASFEKEQNEYEKDVAYWNAQGGAPEKEYDALQEDSEQLSRDAQKLNEQVAVVNALAEQLNVRVGELNTLASALNSQVKEFNSHADTDFDQGRYQRDDAGERITVYEFTNHTELVRVLAHEFGHALGLEHVENPDSIMFSYNVGTDIALTDEDKAELKRVCRLD